MKQIKKEDMKVGDYIYIIDKNRKRERAFIVKIIDLNMNIHNIKISFWKLNEKSKELFEIKEEIKEWNMESSDWEYFNLFKLNKEEISQFNKHLILKNLK